jgi:thiol-disulfide isomerase/thioredoxin
MNNLSKLSLLLAMGCPLAAAAQSVTPPVITTYSNSTIVLGITSNSKWAIFENRGEEATGGKIFDVANNVYTNVTSSNSTDNGSVADISDDGNIVVGLYQDKPAFWNKSTGVWTTLPAPAGTSETGSAVAVTADGKYAVGYVWGNSTDNTDSEFKSYDQQQVMWDLTTQKVVSLNNVPIKDISNSNQYQSSFRNISADGRYILGVNSYSYVSSTAFYVYDVQTETYDYIGFTEGSPNFTAKVSDLHHIESANMSASGKYVTGSAYMVKNDNGTYANEYEVAYRYNCETKEFELFDADGDSGIVGFGIDDNGTIYGATPTTDPMRDIYIRHGKYWYGLSQILAQRYGIDYEEKTGFENTGSPVAVSSDGRVIGTFTDPENGTGYIMRLYEDINTACESVDLMGNYTISPVSGSSFSTLSELTVSFDRTIALKGTGKEVQLLDAAGNLVRNSLGINISNAKATITFRPTSLTAGQTYTIVIPAGTISMATDSEVSNREIRIQYVGREDTPVKPLTIYPTEGSAISKLDYSSSHIVLNFNSNIVVSDENVTAAIYRNDEEEAYESLSMECSGNQLALYPISTLYLYQGNDYRIVIPANAVTDAGGAGGNEEITINYTGNYEREISSDDKTLFSESFDNGLGTQLMFYEGDNNTPTSEMQGYGFTKSTTPWWVGSDESVGDYAAMSHSSYSPAGKSDDWMVIPQIYVPDENCYLSFKSQGFSKSASDHLKVYVIPSETVYNDITSDAIADFKANRILVYDKVQDPGSSEQDLEGDWTPNEISLSDFVDQDIYIAFVNENEDQSIVFVDDIQVIHDMRFLTAVDNETTVVAQDEIEIFGRVAVQSELATYSTVKLTLYDDFGKVVDTIEESGLTLNSSTPYSFRFSKPLQLEKGVDNYFKIVIKLDNEEYTISRTITNLAFRPTKRVFLEEYAGSDCGNCPLGIVTIEKLQKELPNNFIAASIRSYNGDVLGSSFSSYSTYLGLNDAGAPSGIINRTTIAYPMTQVNSKYVFNAPEGSAKLWTDIVYDELDTPAIADITVSATYNSETGIIAAPFNVKYALNKSNVNASILFMVLEDNLVTYQSNYFYNKSDQPNLGEWQKGGIYASSYAYPVYANDVIRAIVGNTINGTQGYIPSKVVAGEDNGDTFYFSAPQSVENFDNTHVVAVLIDNNTDAVVNAAICKLESVDNSGVTNVTTDGNGINISVNADGDVVVASNATTAVQVYDVAGATIATANGEGQVIANTNGYKGVALVKAVTANGTKTAKVIIK